MAASRTRTNTSPNDTEARCLTAESTSRLRKSHNKRIREMCRVAMCQRSSIKYLQRAYKSARVYTRLSTTWQAALYSGLVTSHACPRAGYPKRLMISWVHEPRIEGGQDMTYGRSLERHLKHFGLMDDGGKAITSSEWETLAQDRAGWLKLVTKVPFDLGNPQLRPPRCDTRATPEEKRRSLARRARETEQLRALFNAEADAEGT